MISYLKTLASLAILVSASAWAQDPSGYPGNYAKAPRFKALVYHNEHVETAHQDFARQSLEFLHKLTYGEGWIMDVTTDFNRYTYNDLKDYNVIVMLNDAPSSPGAREAFQEYMENGGGWVGFHAAGYNDRNTNWAWLNQFLGCGQFLCNNWPPQPVLLEVDVEDHPVTKNLPKEFVSASSEWYMWQPSPRENPDVTVLLTLSPKNYPIGLKDVISWGDFPVVWTNNRYRMIYLNMGHGDEEYIDPTQNLLLINALRWVVSRDPAGDPFTK